MSILHSIIKLCEFLGFTPYKYKPGTIMVEPRPKTMEDWETFTPRIVQIILVGKHKYRIKEIDTSTIKYPFNVTSSCTNRVSFGDCYYGDTDFKIIHGRFVPLTDPSKLELSARTTVTRLASDFDVDTYLNDVYHGKK